MFSKRWHYGSPEFSNKELIATKTETDTETKPEEPTPIITMAGSTPKEETVSSEMKRKLKTPMPYSGKREDLRKFLQEVKIYLWGNASLYPNNKDKILFVISYMSDRDANAWK